MASRQSRRAALRRCQMFGAALHLVSASILIGLTANDAAGGYVPAIPTFVRYLNSTPSRADYVEHEIPLRMYPRAMSIVFALLSALFHALHVVDWGESVGVGWRAYAANVRAKRSPLRWVEYAVSATLVLLQIAGLDGLTELAQLVGFAACNVGMIGCGHLAERLWAAEREVDALYRVIQPEPGEAKRERPAWFRRGWVQAFALGAVVGIAPWIAIVTHFHFAVVRRGAPWVVYTIIWGELFHFFVGFPAAMLVQHRRVPKNRAPAEPFRTMGLFKIVRDDDFKPLRCGERIQVRDYYELGEFLFVFLSFSSKTFLSWFSFFAPV